MRARVLSIVGAVVSSAVVVLAPAGPAAYAEPWPPPGCCMNQSRLDHTATVLGSGEVLVAGGGNSSVGRTAELFDPESLTWTPTGSLQQARSEHTATRLGSGQVLVTGGRLGAPILASVERYDPASGTWSPAGSLGTPRTDHQATLLPNGKVLVTGGITTGGARTATAELFDPATGTSTPTEAPMGTARSGHVAVLLSTGTVLVVGGADAAGNGLASAELYDPETGTFTPTGSMSVPRARVAAVPLINGALVLAVGNGSADRYDAATGVWSPTGAMGALRDEAALAVLGGGKVLAAGGRAGPEEYVWSTEVYDRKTNAWVEDGGGWGFGRSTAVGLGEGRALLTGGLDGYGGIIDLARVATVPTPAPAADYGVSISGPVPVNNRLVYQVSVTNHGPDVPGARLTLTLDDHVAMTLEPHLFATSCEPLDPPWQTTCSIGSLQPGEGDVVATVRTPRNQPSGLTATVEGRAADPVAANDTAHAEPAFRPDAMVLVGDGTVIGRGVYSSTGKDQVLDLTVPRGSTANVGIDVVNAGLGRASYLVDGTGGGPSLGATYRVGTQDVTAAVVSGQYDTGELKPNLGARLRLRVTPAASVPVGTIRVFKVKVTAPDGAVDVVRVSVEVEVAA